LEQVAVAGRLQVVTVQVATSRRRRILDADAAGVVVGVVVVVALVVVVVDVDQLMADAGRQLRHRLARRTPPTPARTARTPARPATVFSIIHIRLSAPSMDARYGIHEIARLVTSTNI